MTNVLITGGSSLLGKYLIRSKPNDVNIIHTWYTNFLANSLQLNITDQSQVGYVFRRAKPDVVIHCAAVGSVDFAEQNYSEAHAVNVKGTYNILNAAEDYKAKVVYISSNAVYEGTQSPYKEDSQLKPVNVYGSLKMQAEQRVKDYRDWIIIRPFLLYGWPLENGRDNWATFVNEKLKNNEEMKVVNDVFFQPTYAQHCAEAIWKLISFNVKNEIVNVSSYDRVSLYGFCRMVASIFGYDKNLITSIKSKNLNLAAKRPKDTTFDLTKLNNFDIELPKLKDGIKSMFYESRSDDK